MEARLIHKSFHSNEKMSRIRVDVANPSSWKVPTSGYPVPKRDTHMV
jgi:hypothetical protein